VNRVEGTNSLPRKGAPGQYVDRRAEPSRTCTAYREALDESMRSLDALGELRDPRLLGQLAIDIGNSFALLGPSVHSEALSWYERAMRSETNTAHARAEARP